jgi:hypothetical protein
VPWVLSSLIPVTITWFWREFITNLDEDDF